MEVADALSVIARELEFTKLFRYTPYPYQREFHACEVDNQEIMLRAANRVGKTYSAAYALAFHLTGLYPEPGQWFYPDDYPEEKMRGKDVWPDGWEGRRFDEPILVWAASVTNELSRDVQQLELLGGPPRSADWGKGALPKRLLGKATTRQAGIGGVCDTVEVKHVSGGRSKVIFKSYDQGWRKFQGAAPHLIWLDEEPDDYKIYTECLTRLLTTKGLLLITFTPLLGRTALVEHFDDPDARGIVTITATWGDVLHLDKEDVDRMLLSYPVHERDTRSKGIPMMGAGRVFPHDEDMIKIDPVKIPDHWSRIAGIDFGIDHPFGAVWLAHDRDTDIIYVIDCYHHRGKHGEKPAPIHAEAINRRGKHIFVAWPHDGLDRGKADGVQLQKHYRDLGVNLLPKSARYKKDTGGGQPVEPIVLEINDRIATGRFKVFSTCVQFFVEFRDYHRGDDGKIVPIKDDVLKACMYALMDIRYAVLGISRLSSVPKRQRARITRSVL